jgi:hypothetical protein
VKELLAAAVPERLAALVTRARAVSIVAYEERSPAEIRAELVPQVRELADGLLGLLDELARRADAWQVETGEPDLTTAAGRRAFYRRVDAAVATSDPDRQQLVDLSLLVAGELRRKQSLLLTGQDSMDAWICLGHCGSVLRRIAKGGAAIEQMLARLAGLPPALDYADELAVSLRVRAAFARFRHRLDARRADPLRERLRRGANAIAWLIGQDAYAHVRIGDRAALRSLQHRIVAWQAHADRRTKDGERLWMDLTGVVTLLGNVNLRQELVAHDRALLEGLDPMAGPTVPRELAMPLLGRHELLDRRLLDRGPASELVALPEELFTALGAMVTAAPAAIGEP